MMNEERQSLTARYLERYCMVCFVCSESIVSSRNKATILSTKFFAYVNAG